jgi:hypothetical protein
MRETDWKKVYVMLRPPAEAAEAAAARHAAEVAAFEKARRDAVASGMGRQRYELLPLAVRHALMARRPTAARQAGGGSGGAAAADAQQQQGGRQRRRLGGEQGQASSGSGGKGREGQDA